MFRLYYQTKLGKLYCGDCIEVMSNLERESVDVIISDYPFNSQDGRKNYIEFIYQTATHYYNLLKDGGVLVVINNPYNLWKTKEAYNKFTLRDMVVLVRKASFRPAWHWGFRHNYMVVLVKGKDIKKKWNGPKINHHKDFYDDVLEYQNGYRMKGGYFHPQAIPEWLVELILKTYSNEGDLVLDPFLGSGTTAIVSERLRRKWIGIEINEDYCEMSKVRLKQKL